MLIQTYRVSPGGRERGVLHLDCAARPPPPMLATVTVANTGCPLVDCNHMKLQLGDPSSSSDIEDILCRPNLL